MSICTQEKPMLYWDTPSQHEEIKWQTISLARWAPKGQHIISLSIQHPWES